MKLLKRLGLPVAVMAAMFLNGTAAAADPSLDTPSVLLPHEAAAVIAATVLGETLPPELTLELAKLVRDLDEAATAEAFAAKAQLTQDLSTAVASLGLNGLPALNGTLAGSPFAPGTTLTQVYNTLGLVNTVAWLTGALIVPDLSPFLLPHNIRSVGTYTKTRTTTATSGQPFVPGFTTGVIVGRNFTTTINLDADLLTIAGIDQALLNDTLVIQAPIATQIDIRITCTRVTLGRCSQISSAATTSAPQRLLASNPSYRFAYPVNAGQFATRATASDALMIAYDALGRLDSQKPRDPIASSPFAGIPGFEALVPGTGLADLGTQAPKVTFYGLQTTSDATLLNSLLAAPVSPALNLLGLGSLDLRKHQPVAPQGLLDTGITLPRHRLGMTAGYRASEVRAGKTSIMIVRWQNLGSSTVIDGANNVLGALNASLSLPEPLALPFRSAPATFYYDVPADQYTLTAGRVDTQGGVYVIDYPVAAQAPGVALPPTVNLVAGLTTLTGLLTGAGIPMVPNLPIALPSP